MNWTQITPGQAWMAHVVIVGLLLALSYRGSRNGEPPKEPERTPWTGVIWFAAMASVGTGIAGAAFLYSRFTEAGGRTATDPRAGELASAFGFAGPMLTFPLAIWVATEMARRSAWLHEVDRSMRNAMRGG